MNAILKKNSLFVMLTRLIKAWAIVGGLILLCVILVNFVSTISGFFGAALPGDFELTEMGVAIAAFTFLPFCQLHGSNVSADIFTMRAPARSIALMKLLGAAVAVIFAMILLWRMTYGLVDQFTYGYTTSILRLPHWIAFIPIIFSLFLLAIAGILSCIGHLTPHQDGSHNG